MKRRCPNHWTKGTKKPFFIYLSSENRSGSFCFYTQFKISFVFMLAISDVNSAGRPPFLRVPSPTQWHTNHAPSLSPIIKPPDPFILFFFHPPTPLFRIQKKKAIALFALKLNVEKYASRLRIRLRREAYAVSNSRQRTNSMNSSTCSLESTSKVRNPLVQQ